MNKGKIVSFIKITLLILIALLSLVGRWGYGKGELSDPDSVYMLRLAKQAALTEDHHSGENKSWYLDELSYYPSSRDLRFEELFLPWIGGKLFKVATHFGLSRNGETLEQFLYYLTFVFAGLTNLGVFLLIRVLFGNGLAFLTALFFAVSPAFLVRTWPGSYDKECLAGFLIFMMYAVFYHAAKKRFASLSQIVWAVLAGILFATSKMTWGGYPFYLAVLAASLMGFFIFFGWREEKTEVCRQLALSFFITYAVGTILAWRLMPLACPLWQLNDPIQWSAYLCSFSGGILLLRKYFGDPYPRFALGAIIGLGFLTLLYLTLEYPEQVLNFFCFRNATELTSQHIDEFIGGNWSLSQKYFGTLVYLVPLGAIFLIYDCFRHRRFSSLWMLVWMVAGVFGFYWRKRFSSMLAVPVPFFVLFSILSIGSFIRTKSWPSRLATRRVHAAGFLILTAVTGFFLFETLSLSLKTTPLILKAIEWTKYWREAATWIKSNTPKDALMVSWWDHGYILQTFADRTTLVDGGNREEKRNIDIARMLTHSEDEFWKYLSRYRPGSRPVYIIVSENELSKSRAINALARDHLSLKGLKVPYTGSVEKDEQVLNSLVEKFEIGAYYTYDKGDHFLMFYLNEKDKEGRLHPEWREKLLIKLLPFNTSENNKPLKLFEPVYNNGYVYVYKYVC